MDIFQWDKGFETGLFEVDRQHRHLVNVTNEFGGLLSRNKANPDELEKVFAELVAYTEYHFEEEEKLMVMTGIDERHINSHRQEHQTFLQDITLMHLEMLSGRNNTGKQLFEFLMNWLVYHILGSDMHMARQVEAIHHETPASEAYLAEDQSVDSATGLLLEALNSLFHQVSERNKQLGELNQTLEAKVEERTQALSEANQRLGELAATDVLTGLSNRRYAMQMLEQLWLESIGNETPLACMMIDADGFKEINDTYGHAAGDIVLCELAKQLKYSLRTDDIVCRLGGDEFLVLCPNTNADGAMHIANLTHTQIAALRIPVSDGVWQGSISVGVAVKTASMRSPEDLLKVADQGVYAAKKAGKNCVRMAS